MRLGKNRQFNGREMIEMFPQTALDVRLISRLPRYDRMPEPVDVDHPRRGPSPILVDVRHMRRLVEETGADVNAPVFA